MPKGNLYVVKNKSGNVIKSESASLSDGAPMLFASRKRAKLFAREELNEEVVQVDLILRDGVVPKKKGGKK